MKKTILALFLLLSLAFASQLATITGLDPNGDGFLSLRIKPNGEEIGRLYNGNKVNILTTNGKWYKVKTSSGQIGWAYSKWIKKTYSQMTTATSTSGSLHQDSRYKVKSGYTSSNERTKNIPIPNQFLVKTASGCGAVNPRPIGNESITWTGKCVNGRIDGFGTLTWYQNGEKDTVKAGQHYRNGFSLKISHNDWEDHMITSSTNPKCGFVMPVHAAWRKGGASKLMDVEFKGGCGSNYQGQVKIFFNNRLFAIYRGKLARGNKLPVEGELTYFSGDVYKMGKDPQGYLTSGSMIRGWYDEAHLIRNGEVKSRLSDSDFEIKIGFNTDPTRVRTQYGKIIGFNVRTLNSSNDVILNYSINPKYKSKLTKKQYSMTLEIKIDYTETGSMGFLSMSKDKVVYDYVQITLKRANGYETDGKSKLRKISTFRRALGVNIKKHNFRPSVRIVSIR